ncbi:hypothetical protein P153DRAFT_426781 [Dothidotthia symphoricarpi CBS 119687]|uniref:Uncharacterized protein n=1 Tax=Dothidotthia symphoricarpi CBS 119687 TaxID=1392245 RepID=A0A6A5ZYF0_9PLEO|nr:uncharacterized protein P153DRAFT_426781 [Dothidotthia symphoricarpi CBS 119687]KAF2123903.1 hypothetical protein P153DRAFT_426781 [Dothidotthia symphoricarpi CBS 119687]
MGIGETITVINKSGKVVSNSKHFVSIFKEAKASYRERKAEIKAEKDAVIREKKLGDAVNLLKIVDDDTQSRTSHRSHRSSRSHRHGDRPTLERGHTDTYMLEPSRTSRSRFADLSGDGRAAQSQEIARRNTDGNVARRTSRSNSVDDDLCYGDVPAPLLEEARYDDGDLQEKASKITMLLEEANCLQYSATTAIENLQKNPEALAAVSLTLAEISAIAGKMGPGVLATLKCSFPAVAALLLSPQFMIAGGVAVGVTIVALGGYKIMRKIQATKDEDKRPIAMAAMPAMPALPAMPVQPRIEAVEEPNLLDELEPQELSRVEKWRRGIADIEAESGGTLVDGEFVTPGASKQLVAAGVLDEDDLKSRRSMRIREDGERRKSHRAKSERSVRSEKAGSVRSEKTSHSSRSKSGESRSKSGESKKSRSPKEPAAAPPKKKEKEPSGLRMLFRSHTAA